MKRVLDLFTQAYIECALWSSTDESNEDGGEPLEDNYYPTDIEPETMRRIQEDCAAFQADNRELLDKAGKLYSHSGQWTHDEQAGHDFWLTRNRHGAGFWDRGLGEVGAALTQKAHEYGEFNLIVGDDGRIYGQ